MPISTSIRDDKFIIKLSERFDFNDQAAFRQAYEVTLGSNKLKVDIDFSNVSYIDSAALGMLLLLHDYIGASFSSSSKDLITFKNTSPEIKSILDVAKFSDLFTIE